MAEAEFWKKYLQTSYTVVCQSISSGTASFGSWPQNLLFLNQVWLLYEFGIVNTG